VSKMSLGLRATFLPRNIESPCTRPQHAGRKNGAAITSGARDLGYARYVGYAPIGGEGATVDGVRE
jgi:hypothetical protein